MRYTGVDLKTHLELWLRFPTEAANHQIGSLGSDLRGKNDEALKMHEDTTLLLAQIVDLEVCLFVLIKIMETKDINHLLVYEK